jgi:pullulanase-type alpha-1,6-glucosidase
MRRLLRFGSLLLVLVPRLATAAPQPTSVTVAGSLQSELGCAGDWDPACTATGLAYDPEDGVWQRVFGVPAGAHEFKAALNGSWDENYGQNAARGGANIPLSLADAANVKFYYDHGTHWITSDRNAVIATAPGSFQSELGCGGDWDPGCLRSWLQDPDGDGVYTFRAHLPAGSYEVKVAIGESWTENYGAGGVANGPNIPFTVGSDCAETLFSYDAATHLLTVGPAPAALVQPSSVTIAGSLQSELGCPGDWQPECAATHLAFDAIDGVWQGTFDVPAGSWEYKAPLNDGWTENYGQNATRDGANIPLALAAPAAVKFYYDHGTHWVTSNRNPPSVIATAPGSYQSELGCPGDWQPDCLRSWLQDPDGDGTYVFSTRALPAGSYEVKVAVDESWDLNYGAGGAQNGANIPFTVPVSCQETFFTWNGTTHELTVGAENAPRGNLNRARAHWLLADTFGWGVPGVGAGWTVTLHAARDGGLALGADGVTGGEEIPLSYDPAGLPAGVRERFPHLAGLQAFRLPAAAASRAGELLQGQLALSVKDPGGALVDATSVQIPGVLDDLYAAPDARLGVTWAGRAPTLRVWAPTARAVALELYADSRPATAPTLHPMARDARGVWSVTGGPAWKGRYYRYAVTVWAPSVSSVVTNSVTDPYSVSLSVNSQRSQIVDLDDPALKPPGWDGLRKPRLDAPEDIALYELHVRDFSASDPTVPEALRGSYGAFALPFSAGMRHLSALARAGLTHVHLLPTFDLATVNEDRSTWKAPEGDLASFPPDSDRQQAAVTAVAGEDAFNWGYDPWHFLAPEGSYAVHPDGAQRIREYRSMVQGLARAGLRVVNDVVFNHTNASGQADRSVLDRIVPGYYHRLNLDGGVERSTCCENTASEHAMMEKLMVDAVVLWARQYKVDGFRFDLMGHHMRSNMLKVRAALDALTLGRDGVDGKKVYLYGEAWNFGEVADNARGVNAIQRNMAGTGIGSFNDRLRDGARGGGPFSGIREQGFLTGLYTDPNDTDQGSPAAQLDTLTRRQDWIKVGLAASLADFTFVDRDGVARRGDEIDYNGQQAGYTADPQEIINYVDAHDNETLFDAVQLKAAPGADAAQRARMQNLGMSLAVLAQGVPFLHAGIDLLRSKSLDRNSYDSGDWFNRLDFTYRTHNWGVGLPPAQDNQANWPVMAPLLANDALRPSRALILRSAEHLREVLAIRKSTRLLRLRTHDELVSSLTVYPAPSLPGLLVARVSDPNGAVDPHRSVAVTIFNGSDEAMSFQHPDFVGTPLELHPILAGSDDRVVRTATFDRARGAFRVPARTAAVFWAFRPVAEQIALLRSATAGLAGVPGRSLDAKLAAAEAQARRGHERGAAGPLVAYLNELDALARTGRVDAAAAADLAEQARTVLARLQ